MAQSIRPFVQELKTLPEGPKRLAKLHELNEYILTIPVGIKRDLAYGSFAQKLVSELSVSEIFEATRQIEDAGRYADTINRTVSAYELAELSQKGEEFLELSVKHMNSSSHEQAVSVGLAIADGYLALAKKDKLMSLLELVRDKSEGLKNEEQQVKSLLSVAEKSTLVEEYSESVIALTLAVKNLSTYSDVMLVNVYSRLLGEALIDAGDKDVVFSLIKIPEKGEPRDYTIKFIAYRVLERMRDFELVHELLTSVEQNLVKIEVLDRWNSSALSLNMRDKQDDMAALLINLLDSLDDGKEKFEAYRLLAAYNMEYDNKKSKQYVVAAQNQIPLISDSDSSYEDRLRSFKVRFKM